MQGQGGDFYREMPEDLPGLPRILAEDIIGILLEDFYCPQGDILKISYRCRNNKEFPFPHDPLFISLITTLRLVLE